MIEVTLAIILGLLSLAVIWAFRDITRQHRESYQQLLNDSVGRFERTTRDRDGLLIEFCERVLEKLQTPDETAKAMLQAMVEPAELDQDPVTSMDEQWLREQESIIQMGDDLSPTLDADET